MAGAVLDVRPLAWQCAESVGIRGDEDEVNAVRHQAVRPHLHVTLDSLLAEQVKIDGLVAVFEEDWLAPVSALSASGDDESGESCRMEKCIGVNPWSDTRK
jgi:hypothetical protein